MDDSDEDKFVYYLLSQLGDDAEKRLVNLNDNCSFYTFNMNFFVSFNEYGYPLYQVMSNGLKQIEGSGMPDQCSIVRFLEYRKDPVQLFKALEYKLKISENKESNDLDNFIEIEKLYNKSKISCFYNGKYLMLKVGLSDVNPLNLVLLSNGFKEISEVDGVEISDFQKISMEEFFSSPDFSSSYISYVYEYLKYLNVIVPRKLTLDDNFYCYQIQNFLVLLVRNSDGSFDCYEYNDRNSGGNNLLVKSNFSLDRVRMSKSMNSIDFLNRISKFSKISVEDLVEYISYFRK